MSNTPAKCIKCATLRADIAKSTHDCWVAGNCPSKRYYINNKSKISLDRKKHRIKIVHNVTPPDVIYANLILWRETRNDSPIHAIGVTIWDSKSQISEVQPVHCNGWLPSQVHSYLRQVIELLGVEYGISMFANMAIQSVDRCPISPCPIKNVVQNSFDRGHQITDQS